MLHLTRSGSAGVAAVVFALAACTHDGTGPSPGAPARLEATSDIEQSGVAGRPVAKPLTVRAQDSDGRPVAGATVTFAVTKGNGSVTSRVTSTNSSGLASTGWTLGGVAGENEVTATVEGVAKTLKFLATALPGPVSRVMVSPKNARILDGTDTTRLTATGTDDFGNVSTPAPVLVPRDPTLVSVDSAGLVHALRRGASTYLVATVNGVMDSALVTVLAPGQSICTAVADPVDIGVGQVLTDIAASGTCVHASSSGAEYALVPFFNSTVPGAVTEVDVKGLGLATPGALSSRAPSAALLARVAAPTMLTQDREFELALRERERANMPLYAAGAREWLRSRAPTSRGMNASVSPARSVAVGDLMQINTNSDDYCANPALRTGRVAAVTKNAIVVADTANPAGGFTDAEYESIGITFDTLVNVVDTAAFGTPSDIDNNGRVIMFFTSTVNQLTSRGATSIVLGYFYSRDLLPKTSATGDCPGSNVAEMFYLMVPDPDGLVSDPRTKAKVVSFTSGTVAHEYQHLINASRRLYVNDAGDVQEEVWLNEGLSHIAEELNFLHTAGLGVRQNIDSAALSTPRAAAAYTTFSANNFGRLRRYLPLTESQGPIGSSPGDGDLPTRGAIWTFLRFAADHQTGPGDGTVWYRLVNTKLSGIDNLTKVFGSGIMDVMRDWAVSILADDYATALDPRFGDATWNLRSAMRGVGLGYNLTPRIMSDRATTTLLLSGTGAAFLRFAVPAGADALLTADNDGQPLPSTVRLNIVRLR